MEAHNRKPLYFKSTNPGLAQVDEIASKLFQWDESESKPFEVGQGESFMPPLETEGEYILWSDTHTLGYEAEGVAGPIFFSDGAMGDDKILQIINAVAYRLGEPMFNDVAAAKAWALTETRIYVKDDSVNAPLICDPNVTNTYGGGAGPGNLAASLLRIDRAVFKFNAPSMATEFDTSNLTATKACTLENLEAAFAGYPAVTSTNWSDTTTNPHSYHAWTTNLGFNAIPVVGDVIYRDANGAQYFGEGGFLFQDTSYQSHADGRAFIWVTVGANGVVTNVEPLAYLSESE